MPLVGHTSLCTEHAKIIKSKDGGNPQTHIANNIQEDYVTHYKIDGEVITSSDTRCDFLLINEDKKTAYFIELKGSDLCKAAEQIEATEIALAAQLSMYPSRRYRIVSNRVNTHDIHSSKYKRFQKKWGKNLQQKVKLLEENI